MKVLKNGQKQYLRHEKCVYYSNLLFCGLSVIGDYGLLTTEEFQFQLAYITLLVQGDKLETLKELWLKLKPSLEGRDCSEAPWDLCATR